MKEEIISLAFEKAKKVSGKESVNGRAEFLADYILENFKYSISAKSLIRYYKKDSTPNRDVENYLAVFLGHDNFEVFVVANSGEERRVVERSGKLNRSIPKKKVLISLLLIPVVGISSYLGFQRGGENQFCGNLRYLREPRWRGFAIRDITSWYNGMMIQ
ncbi:hypothetical protein BH23BAC2_BH23BAC2_27860 [soil metagenome]